MAQQTRTSTLAIVSLLLAILAVPAIACFGCGGLAFGVTAVVTGIVARRSIAASDGAETGAGVAVAAIVVGAIAALVGLAFGLIMLLIPGIVILDPFVQSVFGDVVRQLGRP
jgi:hypothetical protein